ncbi:MAG TPA: hypothetical protein ENI49_01305 [Thermoplasmatales archaeon]|nr:hypothetical protein [Thermoplasmatales archaeon]
MVEMEYREWQHKLSKIYDGSGVVKAFAGTGKTYATILLIKNRGFKSVVVAVPTRKLKKQWQDELKKHGATATVETFHILSKPKSFGLKCDMLVVDECHRSVSPVFRRLYDNIVYDNVLGLSATPNKECIKFCGDIIIDLPMEEADISDFEVVFHAIDLLPYEKRKYDRYTEIIKSYVRKMRDAERNGENKWKYKKGLDAMIFKRRDVVYNAKNRLPKAISLLMENRDVPTLVICQRIEQADTISMITGYPVYHSKNHDDKALDDFQHDRVNALLSVGMLKEGYDKRNIKCLIIVSTAITEAHHIQSIGRAVRLPDDATIHILLAKDTTDEKLLKFRKLYKHRIEGVFSDKYLRPVSPLEKLYYEAEVFSIGSDGRIFQRNKKGYREYYKDNPISEDLMRQLNYKGGRFRVTKDGVVLVKSGGKIFSLGRLVEPLVKIEKKMTLSDWQ